MSNYLGFVDRGNFRELFDELGWGSVPPFVRPIEVDCGEGRSFVARPVADQSGLRVWVVESDELPSASEQRLVDAAVKKVSLVRLLIFTDGHRQSWRWPRRGATVATNTKLLHHRYVVGNEELGMDLNRRLQLIQLEIGEDIGILEIQDRMAKAFNDEAVKRSRQASGHMFDMNEQLLDAGCSTDVASSLLVRLLFLFFGDDTNMWPENTFRNWVLRSTDAGNMHDKLTELFGVLCDPELDDALNRKGKYMHTEYENFRRIDGMYKDRIKLPPLTEDFRQQVLKACDFDWGKVNPDIFGAMFQQLVDVDELRKNGEHYTSEENIMKVIKPMFLDEYRARFEEAYDDRAQLLEIQDELASLKFLDPACGCGNFLIQAYKHLRGLEYEMIIRSEELELAEIKAELAKPKPSGKRKLQRRLQEIETGGFINFSEGALRKSKLSMRQFYGIEINEWPAKVAATAMLLVDHLCNQVWGQSVVKLPIEETPEIRQANALRIDWNEVVPNAKSTVYVLGNPPFVGHSGKTPKQRADLKLAWGDVKGSAKLDYVTAWFVKAMDFLEDKEGEFSFVSTNSIVQGQSVSVLFRELFTRGWKIRFAHRSFEWDSEAEGKAAVHCVILGFAREISRPRLWDYDKVSSSAVEVAIKHRINAYLLDGPNVVVEEAEKPLSTEIAECAFGSMPLGKNLIIEEDQYPQFASDPIASKYLRKFVGSYELLNDKDRWCLWMGDPSFDKKDIEKSPLLAQRVKESGIERSNASKTGDAYKYKDTPWLFRRNRSRPLVDYLCVPGVESENREYFTVKRFSPDVIASNATFTMPDEDGLQFAIVSSAMFMTWQRMVGGRMKSDLRFAKTLTWYTFPFPSISEKLRGDLISAGRGVEQARSNYPDKSLADLYQIGDMPTKLKEAHAALDALVDEAFRADGYNITELQRQDLLFKSYLEMSKS